MATDEQNVYITGAAGGLADWAKEGTQSAIAQSLKQIQADNNQMLRFLHKIANGEKTSAAHLAKLGAEIKQTRQTTATAADQAGARDTKNASSDNKMLQNSHALLSAFTGMNSTLISSERAAKSREATYQNLLNQGFDETAANMGANAKSSMDRHSRLIKNAALFAGSVMTMGNLAASTTQEGYNERYAMVAEMRQAGLLASVEQSTQGFIEMSNMISNTNFTFGQATDYVKQFSKAVGVKGVESTLDFANTLAKSKELGGMDLMRRYAMDFGQVANMSGEYLDSLRISGQLQGRSDDDLYSGMGDFMTNVEMTSNILKISMVDAAEAMKNSLKAEDVALLSTLPAEQRKAIENGFLAMGANAQGNPMAETLAARLSAGGSAQFLQTAEYQQMAGTSVGREVLTFVEKMAQELEGGTSESFSAALADQFPKFADQLTEMASQGGVRVQLLSDKQLASMVGSIITAAENFGTADKGMADARKFEEDTAAGEKFIQLREAAVLSESTMNQYMDSFTSNMQNMTKAHREFAETAAEALVFYEPVFAVLSNISTGAGEIATNFMSEVMKMFTGNTDVSITDIINKQGGRTQYQDATIGDGYSGDIGLDQQDNTRFNSSIKTFLNDNKGVLKNVKNFDPTGMTDEVRKEQREILNKNMFEYQEKMVLLAAKIATDEGSKKEDDKWTKQAEELFKVFNALTALTHKLDNNTTQ